MHNLAGLVEAEKKRIIAILEGIHTQNKGKLTPAQVQEVAARMAKEIYEVGSLQTNADDALDEHQLAQKLARELVTEGRLAGLKWQVEHENLT